MKLRAVADSVAGQKCIIFYDGDKPLATVWLYEGQAETFWNKAQQVVQENLTNLTGGEIHDLIKTLKAFGANYIQISKALNTYLEDRWK